MTLLVTLAFGLVPAAACQPISSDHVHVHDLTAVAPIFASLPQDLELGFAPMPGQVRVFHPADLRRIAGSYRLKGEFSGDVCFAWHMSVPAQEDILHAMYSSLEGRNPRIEIFEQSFTPVPDGELVFPFSGISGVSSEPVVWRGYVKYGENRRFQIWARTRIQVQETHVIATASLRPGRAIVPADLRLESYQGPPLRGNVASSVSRVAGKLLCRPIPSGGVLSEDDLVEAREVESGDIVQVIVDTGRARIEAQGVAEEGGRLGTVINVENESSGKKFRARIEAKDKVLVVPGPIPGIAAEEKRL